VSGEVPQCAAVLAGQDDRAGVEAGVGDLRARGQPVGRGDTVVGHVPDGHFGAGDGEEGAALIGEEAPGVLTRLRVGERVPLRSGLGVEQGRAGLGQRSEPPGRDGEQGGGAGIGGAQAVGHRRQAAGGRLGRLFVTRPVALPGQQARGQGQDEERGEPHGEQTGTAGSSRPCLPLGIARGAGGVEEGPLQLGEVVLGLPGEQLFGLGQPCAPVQRSRVPLQLLPGTGRLPEQPLRPQPPPALLDPAGQPGPAGDQHLVGQLDRVTVQGDQPGGGEALQHVPRVGPQLGPGRRAARVGGAVAGGDEPQQDAAGGTGLLRREAAVDLLGTRGDRPAYATGLLVRGQRESAAAATAPGLQQGVREHRQGAGLVGDLVDDTGGQRALHVQALGDRGLCDHVPQFLAAHRSDQQGRAADRLRELRMGAAVAVEVAAHGDGHTQPVRGLAGGQQ
jgi:hypothetical protein